MATDALDAGAAPMAASPAPPPRPLAAAHAVTAFRPLERPAASPAPPDQTLRTLRRRVVILALICALPGWWVAYGMARSGAPVVTAAPVSLAVPPSPGSLVPALLLAAASLALGLWLLRGLRRDLDAVAADVAGGRQLSRLLQIRTRERDHALRATAALTWELQHDALTRLASRSAFLQRLDAALHRRAKAGGALAIFFIDLDDFKAVNDRHGHTVGDALLSAFATRLGGEVRAGDLAARLSGDEFAVLLDGLSATQAEPVAQALVQCLSSPYGLGDQTLQVSASIGVAAYPEDGRTAAELMRAADGAMYQAKAAGKRDVRLVRPRASGVCPAGPGATGP